MPDLNDMAVFAQVAQARSFSGAARRMKASKSRVSKSVARLERALGARLVNRTTRSLSLTEAGEAFYRHCSRIVEEAAQAALAVSAHHAEPQGLLRVSAPGAFGATQLAQALPGFLSRHPKVRLELCLAGRASDVVRGGYDVAISVGEEDLPLGLASRRLGSCRRVLCAAPGYLREHGTPHAPQELARHNCLHSGRRWRLGNASHAVQGSLRADDERTLWQAARAGLGISLLPAYLVEDDVRRGRLVALLGAWPAAPDEIHALRMPGVPVAPKVRALIDHLCIAMRFSSMEAWNADVPESRRRRGDERRGTARVARC